MMIPEDDYQELTGMSTKEFHVLSFWRKALIECYTQRGACSAGEVGRYVGQSRTTAKKYLDRLVGEKIAWFEEVPWKNGVMSKIYGPTKRAAS